MTLFLISFAAGVLTVLSPCVLPLLPVIVGGSLAGGRSVRRALTVTVALGVSVFLFTIVLKVSTLFVAVPAAFWNWLSGGLLFFVGIFFLFPHLWSLLPGTARANRDANKLMSSGFMRQSFWGDVLVGAALGPVFSTCSPTYFVVLAGVLPVSLAVGLSDILAYILGLCLFLFGIALAGQRFMGALGVAANQNGWFRKGLGVVFMLLAVFIVTNTLATIEAPLYSIFDETNIERQLLPEHVADTSAPPAASTTPASFLTLAQKSLQYQKAPEFVSPSGYVNTNGAPVSLASLRGKVVLVDFWDYSCINCERTLPYVEAWYEKYKDEGLVVVGVHTPEFAFEHALANVADAAKRFGLTYPIVLDNDYRTWNAYQNEYWPREYLVDIDGFIMHDHAGEGDYAETERAIQNALAERAARAGMHAAAATTTVSMPETDMARVQSPETYFGSARNERLGNGTPGVPGMHMFSLPAAPEPNTLYLGGRWNVQPEYVEGSAGTSILFEYSAHDVYIVAANASAGTKIRVLRDGQPVGSAAGADVDPKTSEATIDGDRLYTLIHDTTPGVHTIRIDVESGTLDAYTFTFG